MRRAEVFPSKLAHAAAQPVLVLLCCGPAVALLWGATQNTLGANPAEALIRSLGDWTLRWLCLTLAVTPLREALQWPALARLRRTLGLTTFVYASLHLLAYAWLDMGLDWASVWADTLKRRFILVGVLSWTLLLALAATSFPATIRALGALAWKRLHRAVYAVAGLAILHFAWMRSGKADYAEVWWYAAVLGALLAWRLRKRIKIPSSA
jgi:sulfoxide reductase heme-binding subunit YedZ